jgi:sugar phosphate isomerase/epimerase
MPGEFVRQILSRCGTVRPHRGSRIHALDRGENAKAALRIVSNANEPNGRVLVNALHVARSATTFDDIASLPRHLLSYAQLCDAPAGIPATHEELIHTARCARLLPGDGGIDLRGLLLALPDDLPLSLEIPNDEWLSKLDAEE